MIRTSTYSSVQPMPAYEMTDAVDSSVLPPLTASKRKSSFTPNISEQTGDFHIADRPQVIGKRQCERTNFEKQQLIDSALLDPTTIAVYQGQSLTGERDRRQRYVGWEPDMCGEFMIDPTLPIEVNASRTNSTAPCEVTADHRSNPEFSTEHLLRDYQDTTDMDCSMEVSPLSVKNESNSLSESASGADFAPDFN